MHHDMLLFYFFFLRFRKEILNIKTIVNACRPVPEPFQQLTIGNVEVLVVSITTIAPSTQETFVLFWPPTTSISDILVPSLGSLLYTFRRACGTCNSPCLGVACCCTNDKHKDAMMSWQSLACGKWAGVHGMRRNKSNT